jgi:hypothetical protein
VPNTRHCRHAGVTQQIGKIVARSVTCEVDGGDWGAVQIGLLDFDFLEETISVVTAGR